MIKAITGSKLVKNLAVASMITAGALGAGALNAKTKTNVTNPNQTEVVSKAGAQALQVYNTQTNIPTDINWKQTEKMGYFTVKNDNNLLLPNIEYICNKCGAFAGAVQVQEIIDEESIKYVYKNVRSIIMNNMTKEESKLCLETTDKYLAEVKKYIDKFDNAQIEAYNLLEVKPTSQQVLTFLDNYAQNLDILSYEQKQEYKTNVSNFKQKQVDKSSTEAITDLIAYKTFLIDKYTYEAIQKKYNGLDAFSWTNATTEKGEKVNTLVGAFHLAEIKP